MGAAVLVAPPKAKNILIAPHSSNTKHSKIARLLLGEKGRGEPLRSVGNQLNTGSGKRCKSQSSTRICDADLTSSNARQAQPQFELMSRTVPKYVGNLTQPLGQIGRHRRMEPDSQKTYGNLRRACCVINGSFYGTSHIARVSGTISRPTKTDVDLCSRQLWTRRYCDIRRPKGSVLRARSERLLVNGDLRSGSATSCDIWLATCATPRGLEGILCPGC